MDPLKKWLYNNYSKENPIPTDLIQVINNSNIPESLAKHTSFDFLGDFNFLSSGNAKLKISITKNIHVSAYI